MKYKNIIFDVGGVLLSYRWLGIVMESEPDREKAKAFAKRLFDDPLWLEFDIELRPFDDVLEDYVRKYPEDEKHIRYALGHLERMPIPRPKVWEKVHALKQAGYKLYLLSNYSSRMFHAHTDGLSFLDDMDGHIISYEVHSLKPYKEIYEALFEKYSLDPAECFFFDDRQENVDGGRKCGMEGRTIYSEDVLLGYLDRLLAASDETFPLGISNKFHDASLPRNERIEWLLSQMTLEEKILMYSHPECGAGRLGVEGFVLGGEAAHGVEARNDQNGIKGSDITTSFPNPIGMSSSWDKELIKEAGRITGTEARACFKRHRKTGLSRWAPTIDMERDPRWGRNEEGYGEDPYLTGVNASAYIQGMQGGEPDYIRCGATLKHYYANNTEKDRFFMNSSVGLRDKYDYYLSAFRKAVKEVNALGVMTAYNKINGVPGMMDPEVKTLLKDKYGLTHAVSDGFAMVRLKDFHHEYGTLAECVAASVKAGVDSMSDKPEDVEKALRDALELSLLSEDELDGALKNILMVGMKLGIYDPEGACPYDAISADDTDTEEARNICRKLSEESLVLLENRDHTLLLDKNDSDKIALVGPLADEWYKDWYAGVPPFKHTVREGLSDLLGRDIKSVKGLDKFKIYAGDKAWQIDGDGSVVLSDSKEAELFYIEDWGEDYHTIRSVSTGKYVQSFFYEAEEDSDKGLLKADKDDVFDWFVTCRFHIEFETKDLNASEDAEYQGSRLAVIRDRFAKPVSVTSDGELKADDTLPFMEFKIEKAEDGIDGAIKASEHADTVILVLGCNPLIPAREDFDRTSLALPSGQQKILDAFTASDKKVVLVLLSNYPYTMNGAEKKADAILLSPTGSEYMGDAVASALFGEVSPAGRLVQSWPVSEDMLPDINDYRIIGKRTYRFISEGWIYPFGYGLSYGNIVYSDMKVSVNEASGTITIRLNIENIGDMVTDEVVQIYASADFNDGKFTDAGYGRRLIGFERIKDVKSHETREVMLNISTAELQVYDVVSGDYIIYDGVYHIYTGHNALNEAVSHDVQINGQHFAERNLSCLTPVYACDDYENIEFVKGAFGMTAATVLRQASFVPTPQADLPTKSTKDDDTQAGLVFIQSRLPEETEKATLILKSEKSGSVDILWNGKAISSWSGNTSTPEKPMTAYNLPSEHTIMPDKWTAEWREIECSIKDAPQTATGTLRIKLSGDVKLLGIKFIPQK